MPITAFLVIVLALLITAWSGLHYSHPYRFFAELQRSLFGINYVQLSAMATFCITMIALAGVGRLLAPLYPKRPAPGARGSDRIPARFDAKELTVLAFGSILLIPGGIGWWRATTAGPAIPYSLAQADRDEAPSSRHVSIHDLGPSVGNPAQVKDGNNVYYYHPMSSGHAPDRKLHLFIRSQSSRWSPPASDPVTGTLEVDDLPGALRVRLEDAHVLAARHFVLHPGSDPRSDSGFMMGMAILGGVFLGAGLLGPIGRRHQVPPDPPSAPTPASLWQRFVRWTIETRWWNQPFSRTGLALTLALPLPMLIAADDLTARIFGAGYYQAHSWPAYAAFMAMSLVLAVAGAVLNRNVTEFRRRHRGLWVPLEYSPLVYGGLILLTILLRASP